MAEKITGYPPNTLFPMPDDTLFDISINDGGFQTRSVRKDELISEIETDFDLANNIPGTSGQTLRHNGTNWIANSLLYNNGSRIGINNITPDPTKILDVTGDINFNGSFNVDVNTFVVNASTNRVGLGTSSPVAQLDVKGSGTGRALFGEAPFSSSYGMASFNGTLGNNDYNILSGTTDKDLYLNRPSGYNFYIREGGSAGSNVFSIEHTTSTLKTMGKVIARGLQSGFTEFETGAVEAYLATSLTAPTMISVDTTAFAQGVGGSISFCGNVSAGLLTGFAQIRGIKENSTDSNKDGALVLYTRDDASGNFLEGFRVDSNQYCVMKANNSAIADAALSNSQLSWYINEAGNSIIVKVKYSGGTVKTATIALV